MQRVGQVASTGELLFNLSLALYDAHPNGLTEPGEEQFTDHNPYTAFDRFLKRLDRTRARRRFIITVDEFEDIEKLITEEVLEARLLTHWRGMIQTYPWFIMAFAGLHTLREMTKDYWHPLFGSVNSIPVSFLSHQAAARLITNPTPDFALDYDPEATEQIIALTNGQPFLIQLICHGLVTRFNRQTFEEGVERERRFTVKDVEVVVATPAFYRDGNAYFTGVWAQAKATEPHGQTVVLHVLAKPAVYGEAKYGQAVWDGGGLITGEEIAQEAELPVGEVRHALTTLERHDVVIREGDRWRISVELMRR